MSELAEQLIIENLETKDPRLDLGNCGLDGSESCLELLGECDHLEELFLSNHWVDNDEEFRSKNAGEKNVLIQLPKKLPQNLQKLIASSDSRAWNIVDLSPLSELQYLKILYLQGNDDLADLSPLKTLQSLEILKLDLSSSLQDISSVNHLARLKELSLDNCTQLREVHLDGLSYLTKLDFGAKNEDLYSISLTNLDAIEELNLQFLFGLHTLHLDHLPSLKKLNLDKIFLGNDIMDFGFLENLPNLTYLDLSGCRHINDISSIGKMEQLQWLRLGNNGNMSYLRHLNDISPLEDLHKLSYVDLSGCINLENLSVLTNLKSLRKLKLNHGFTNFVSLPSLPQLAHLDLSRNELADLSSLPSLPQLAHLDLSRNELADLSSLPPLPQLAHLDLSHNKITDLSSLPPLPQLAHLDLSHNKITDLSSLPPLPQLAHLDLSHNKITDLSSLPPLPQLAHLDLSHNKITDLSSLPPLPQLTHLDLSNNEITDLSSLPSLPQLAHLDLSRNKITDPTPIDELENLKSLNLQDNQIDDPKTFGKFQEQLKVLAKIVTNIDITSLENQHKKAIQQFLDTYKIYLNGDTRDDIIYIESQKNFPSIPAIGTHALKKNNPHSPYLKILQDIISNKSFTYERTTQNFSLAKLKKLDSLNLSYNYISDFLSISLPKNISELNLERNFIEEVKLSGFTRLKTLQLDNNFLASFNLNNCNALATLHLERNELKKVTSTQLGRLPKLNELFLKDNPIQNIPKEIYNKGGNVLNAIKNYFKAQGTGSVLNTQAKVIWVGNGEVGKTTLSHQLRHNKYQPSKERTHGIWVDDWVINYSALPQKLQEKFDENKPEKIVLKMWDFGGQEYYHATHRLFLSSNALYVLVWDEANNQQSENKEKEVRAYPKGYWRKNIAYHAPKNVVLEVQNKARDRYEVDLKDLKLKVGYRDEADKHSIAQYGLDIQQLKKSLLAQLPALEHLGRPFPKVYDDIRRALENEYRDFLSVEEYRQLCQQNDVTENKIMQDEGQIQTLTQYLHETGAIICYHYEERLHTHSTLRDYVFTRPDWVTEHIYQILAKNQLEQRINFAQGEFNLAHIRQATQGTGLAAELWLELMLAFELVFQIRKNDKKLLVAPQYLPEACANQEALDLLLQNSNILHSFTLNFPEFLPKSLFLRFIAKYGKHNKRYLYWESGLFFTHEFGKSVYATCDYPNRRIKVAVQEGNAKVAHDIFKFFLDKLDARAQVSLEEQANYWVVVRTLEERIQQQDQEVLTACGKHILQVSDFAFLFGQGVQTGQLPSRVTTKAQGAVIITAFANPDKDLNVAEEKKQIQRIIEPLERDGVIKKLVIRDQTSQDDYFEAINTWENQINIFHFGGHANAEQLGLENQNTFFSPVFKQLVTQNKQSLKLVFLNGCSTKWHVEKLLSLGVKAIIATKAKVNDDLARKFAVCFYDALAKGKTIQEAFETAHDQAQSKENKKQSRRFRFLGAAKKWSKVMSDIKESKDVEEFPWGLYFNDDAQALDYKL